MNPNHKFHRYPCRSNFIFVTSLCCLLTLSPPIFSTEPSKEPEMHYQLNKINQSHYVSGQPGANDFTQLNSHGIRNIVSLRPPEETPHLNEAAIATELHMAYYNVPIDKPEQITYEKVATWHQLLQSLKDQPSLLHCASGNRVGAMMAAHAYWFKDKNIEEAIAIGETYGLTRWRDPIEQQLNKSQ